MIGAFLSLPSGVRSAIIGGAAVAVALAAWTLYQRQDAANDALEEVREDDEQAISAADAAALGLRECLSRDGVFWDFAAGKCERGEPSVR